MDSARRAADADDIYGMPIPSPDAHMTMDELRRALLHEGIRQRVILAELAERWELEAELQRELGLDGDVRFRQRTMPHRGASLLPHGEPLDGRPLALAGMPMSRPHVKDRIEEWYQPPWRRTASEEDAPILGAKLRKKEVSGVKWKRTAETPPLTCSIHDTKCYGETDLENHLRGRKLQENIVALQGEDQGTKAKLHEKKAPQLAEKNQKPVSRWMCSICNANCTFQSDLESHFQGRRHQDHIEPLQEGGKGTEAKLHEKKTPQLERDSRWMCSICNANCTSQSDLESHLRGRRHHENIEALRGGGKGTETKLLEKNMPQLEPISRWMCSVCNANCTSQSDLESHLRGRRHQENIEALQGGGMGTEAKLHEKNMPQLEPVSRWMCSICSASCTSQSDLESHIRGRRHQENIALQGEGMVTEVKQHEKITPQLEPVSRWMCSICNANCTSQFDLEKHLRGRRHRENIAALQGDGKGTKAKQHEKKTPKLELVSRWMCSICNANCTSQSDLESHLRGRRHQENIEDMEVEGKGSERISRWMCSICNANCTSQSDLESHLRGRRHQENIEDIKVDGKGSEPISRWMCGICNANCTSQYDLESHLRGRRHQENIEDMEVEGKGSEPISRWMCSICNANCTSQSDLENHLRGRRHQENIEDMMEVEGKGSDEKLHEMEVPWLMDKNQKPVSRWMCSICNANCTSQSDLESHLRGRRHQENIEALQGESKGTEPKLHEKKAPQLANKNQKPFSWWMCKICNANCTSQSDLESHLRGRRHQENIEALQGESKGTEAKLHEKKAPQLANKNQKPFSWWMCKICNANCTSQSDLESHLRGRRHQENIEAMEVEGKGSDEKLHEMEASQFVVKKQKPVSRWMCNICNANCTSQSDLDSHLQGRRHQRNVQAQA